MSSTVMGGAIVALATFALGIGLAGDFRVPSAAERREARPAARQDLRPASTRSGAHGVKKR